jgi:hypothetical protein
MALPPPICMEMRAFYPILGWFELSAELLYTTLKSLDRGFAKSDARSLQPIVFRGFIEIPNRGFKNRQLVDSVTLMFFLLFLYEISESGSLLSNLYLNRIDLDLC